MTTEYDFQSALDARPTDWQTRLVFADWLEERGDPRAEGYRVLGRLRRYPYRAATDASQPCWALGDFTVAEPSTGPDESELPKDWFDRIFDPKNKDHEEGDVGRYCLFFTRREAEDVAARAFTKLPPARRTELLTEQVPS